MFGYTPAEVVGRTIFDTIVPPEYVDEKRKWLAAAVEAGSAIYESVRRRKDGANLFVDVAVTVVRDGNGVRTPLLNEWDVTRIKYQREYRAAPSQLGKPLARRPSPRRALYPWPQPTAQWHVLMVRNRGDPPC